MELLEKDDPIKSQLLEKSAHYRDELEQDVKLISERTQRILTTALVVGGALALTYLAVRQFGGSKSGKKKLRTKKIKLINAAAADDDDEETVVASAPSIVTQIGTALASQATMFLLQLAKEKLNDYLQSNVEKKD
jgi:mannose/fructose/N-acetylgalactosamine-specific phosphotransferase system component IIC